MSSRQANYDSLYFDRLRDSRQPLTIEIIWKRVQQPDGIISVLILFGSILYHLYGSPDALESGIRWLGSCIWNTLVYLTPSPLINSIDNWHGSLQTPRSMQSSRSATHAEKSATMRRLLGLDQQGGMMASVFKARTRAISITGNALGLKGEVEKPPGLGNRDNSCFQNSILQGLAALNTFPDYLENCLKYAGAAPKNTNGAVTQTLQELLADLNSASNNGRTLWTPNKLKFMSTWTQQDAQEYYSKILDDIDKGAAKALQASRPQPGLETPPNKDDAASSEHSDDSGYQSLSSSTRSSDSIALRNPLEGLLAQRVACVQCGYSEGLSMIPFNCLTLSLGLGRREHDLYERLDAYSDIESIEGVECAKCTLLKAQRLLSKLLESLREKGAPEAQLAEPRRRLQAIDEALEEDDFEERTLTETCKISQRGKVTTTKTKQVVIARPPQSLAIHINRSVFDPSTFNTIKNSAPVKFPTTLDIGPWCLGSADNDEESNDSQCANSDSGHGDEQWHIGPTSSMVAGDLKHSKLSGPIYELRAVVTHAGRHENGHYICYRKYPRISPPSSPVINEKQTDGDVEDHVDSNSPTNTNIDTDTIHDASQMDWWRLSDHNVSKVDEEVVSNLSSGVFMLFYDCIDPSMILSSDSDTMSTKSSEDDDSGAITPTDDSGVAVEEEPDPVPALAPSVPLPAEAQDPVKES
jgi:ubiquitin carboxyl-terminal hydrolase 1